MIPFLLIYFRIKKVTLVVRGGGRGLAGRVEDTQGFPQVYGFDSLSTIAAVVHARILMFCLRAKPCALFCLHVQGQTKVAKVRTTPAAASDSISKSSRKVWCTGNHLQSPLIAFRCSAPPETTLLKATDSVSEVHALHQPLSTLQPLTSIPPPYQRH